MKLEKPQMGHQFTELVQNHPSLDEDSITARWARLKIHELQEFDGNGTRFRYADQQEATERLVSLHHVRAVATHLLGIFGAAER